jgi:hypothetical protein
VGHAARNSSLESAGTWGMMSEKKGILNEVCEKIEWKEFKKYVEI